MQILHMVFSDSYLEHWKTGFFIALFLHLAVLLMAIFGPNLLKLHKQKEEIYTVKLFAPVEQPVKSKDSPAPNEVLKKVPLPPSKQVRKLQPPKPARKIVKQDPAQKSKSPPPEVVQKESVPAKSLVPDVKRVDKKQQKRNKAVSLKPHQEKKKVLKSLKSKPVKKKTAERPAQKVAKPKSSKKKGEAAQDEKLARRLAAIKEQVREKEETKRLEERLKALREQVKKEKRDTSEHISGASVSGRGRATSINEIIAEYGSRVSSEIWRRWNLPTSLIDQNGLEAVIEIRIADDGTILERRFEKASGDLIFDRSAMRAVKEAPRVPPLPPQLRPGPLVMGIRFRPEGM